MMKFLFFIGMLVCVKIAFAQQRNLSNPIKKDNAEEMRASFREIKNSSIGESEKTELCFQKVKAFVTANPTDFLSFDFIGWVKYLDTTRIDSLYNLVDPSLKSRMKENIRRQKIRAALQKGQDFPELILTDSSNRVLDIASLKGKMILINVWASWCGPCRAEMPKLKILYERYKDSGFTVIAVSLDDNKQKWLNAISSDVQPWMQFCELNIWRNSSWFRRFGIDSVPYNFLLNTEGKLIDKEIDMNDLENYLTQQFKQ